MALPVLGPGPPEPELKKTISFFLNLFLKNILHFNYHILIV
jgi:hypothetical protein